MIARGIGGRFCRVLTNTVGIVHASNGQFRLLPPMQLPGCVGEVRGVLTGSVGWVGQGTCRELDGICNQLGESNYTRMNTRASTGIALGSVLIPYCYRQGQRPMACHQARCHMRVWTLLHLSSIGSCMRSSYSI